MNLTFLTLFRKFFPRPFKKYAELSYQQRRLIRLVLSDGEESMSDVFQTSEFQQVEATLSDEEKEEILAHLEAYSKGKKVF